jgi:chromosome segregation ATPase
MHVSIWQQRLVHYQFLEELLEGRRVLELGCGSGEGAQYLSRRAGEVLAVDTSANQLERCRALPGRPNLNYRKVDPSRLQEADGSFGVVLVPELNRWINRGSVVPEILRLLGPQGVAVFAVPSGDLPAPGGITLGELKEFLGQGFSHARIYGQIPFSGYTLADFEPGGDASPLLDCSLVAEDEPPVGYLALCSREPLESLGYAVLQVPAEAVAPPAVAGVGGAVAEAPGLEFGAERESSRLAALERLLQQERDRVDRERDRAEEAARMHLEQRGRADAEAVRAEAVERSLEECRRSVSQLSRRAETAERRNDSLLARVEQGSAELSRLHQRMAEMQGLRQAEQWRVDELNGRLRECEEQLLAARAGEPVEPVDAPPMPPQVVGDLPAETDQVRTREQELRQEISRLQEQEEGMVGRLQQRLAGAKERARVADSEATEAREQAEQLQARVEELEAAAAEWEQERAHLEKELMKSESRVVEQSRRATNAEAQIAQMEVRLKRSESEASTLSKWAEELREDLKDAQGIPKVGPLTPEPEVAALRNDLRLAEERNQELEQRCDRFIKEAEESQAALREKDGVLQEALAAVDGDLVHEVQRLRKEAEAADDLRQRLQACEEDLTQVNEKYRDTEQAGLELKRAHAELTRLRKRVTEVDALSDELEQLRLQQLQASVEGASPEQQDLQARLADREQEIRGLRQELANMRDELQEARSDLDVARADLDEAYAHLREPAEPGAERGPGADPDDELEEGWEQDEQDEQWDEKERLIVRERQLDALLEGAATHRREMSAQMAQVLELQERVEELKGEADELEELLAACNARHELQHKSQAQLRNENTRLARHLAQLEGQLKRLSPDPAPSAPSAPSAPDPG